VLCALLSLGKYLKHQAITETPRQQKIAHLATGTYIHKIIVINKQFYYVRTVYFEKNPVEERTLSLMVRVCQLQNGV
jgi:predicted RNA binding protein with dsRBD fold (UPF0201 family)